jgi:pimeloyl-ACP methyl ester carboxylesterase
MAFFAPTKKTLTSLVILISLFLAGEGHHLWVQRGTSESVINLQGSVPVPVLQIKPDPAKDTGLSIILLHCWRCNGAMLRPLSRMLARNGITAYIPDFPGHGAANSPTTLSCVSRHEGQPCRFGLPELTFLPPLLDDLIANQKLSSVGLIGHSWGGMMLGYLAETNWKPATKVVARVNLEGHRPTAAEKLNSLYFTWPGNDNYFGEDKPDMIAAGTRGGQFSEGTAFEYYEHSKPVTHSGLMRDNTVNEKILSWFREAGIQDVGFDTRPLYLPSIALAWILAFSLVLFFSGLAVQRVQIEESMKLNRKYLVGSLVLAIILARFASSHLVWQNRIFETMHFLGSYNLISLSLAGVIGFIFFLLIQRPRGFDLQIARREIVIGVMAFAVVYFTLGAFINSHYYHTTLSQARLPRFLAFALGLWPLVYLIRRAAWTPARRGLRFFILVGYWAAVAIAVKPGLGLPAWPEYSIYALMGAELFAYPLETSTKSKLAASVFSSIFVSWVMGTQVPIS